MYERAIRSAYPSYKPVVGNPSVRAKVSWKLSQPVIWDLGISTIGTSRTLSLGLGVGAEAGAELIAPRV